ncbi:MAG: hypothetical protein ACRCX2_36075 [Paraclostridium sp.]
MTYLNNYRKRVGIGNVSNSKDKLIFQAKRQFEKSLQYDPSALLLRVSNVDEVNISNRTRKITVIINDYSPNDQRSFDEKILLTRIEDNVDVGCYVEFDDCFWIVVFEDHNSVQSHKKFTIRKCNQILKYKYKGVIYEIPVCVKNLVQYSDGMQDIVYTSMPDAKRSITYGVNHITKNIDLGQRVMINNKNVYSVTHIDDSQYNATYVNHDGIASAIVVHTASTSLDDFENNLADNDDRLETLDFHIQGENNVMPGGKFRYNLSPAKYTDWTIEYIGKDKGYVSVSRSGDDCILDIRNDIGLIGNEFKLISLNIANVKQADKVIKVKGF